MGQCVSKRTIFETQWEIVEEPKKQVSPTAVKPVDSPLMLSPAGTVGAAYKSILAKSRDRVVEAASKSLGEGNIPCSDENSCGSAVTERVPSSGTNSRVGIQEDQGSGGGNTPSREGVKRTPKRRDALLRFPSLSSIDSSRESKKSDKLNKYFGYRKNLNSKYELEDELGRGHFGHTCRARVKRGSLKGKEVAVKIIPKAKMNSKVAIEDVKREVSILRVVGGHDGIVTFYDAYEDGQNVYIVMELCAGGELLERILLRGGRFPEDEAKLVILQILKVVAFCHQQGVVHRDLKPENFLFSTRSDTSSIRVIDFGLSGFVLPDQRLKDIVGSAYYIAPEVLRRTYSIEADMWSVGVISYILLSGSRPFWARTESGIFQAVMKSDPNFSESPWPKISDPALDFVQRCLSKDFRRRPSAAQALTHPWFAPTISKVPLDITLYNNVRSSLRNSVLCHQARKMFVKMLSDEELLYFEGQFALLDTDENGFINFEDLSLALYSVATDLSRTSRVCDVLNLIDRRKCQQMDLEDFCAMAMNIYQLELSISFAERAEAAYQLFLDAGHAFVSSDALFKEIGAVDSSQKLALLAEWTNKDGSISQLGFQRLLHGHHRSRKNPISQRKFARLVSGCESPGNRLMSSPNSFGSAASLFSLTHALE